MRCSHLATEWSDCFTFKVIQGHQNGYQEKKWKIWKQLQQTYVRCISLCKVLYFLPTGGLNGCLCVEPITLFKLLLICIWYLAQLYTYIIPYSLGICSMTTFLWPYLQTLLLLKWQLLFCIFGLKGCLWMSSWHIIIHLWVGYLAMNWTIWQYDTHTDVTGDFTHEIAVHSADCSVSLPTVYKMLTLVCNDNHDDMVTGICSLAYQLF